MSDQELKELLALSWKTRKHIFFFPFLMVFLSSLFALAGLPLPPSFVERFEQLTVAIVVAERKKSQTQMVCFNN